MPQLFINSYIYVNLIYLGRWQNRWASVETVLEKVSNPLVVWYTNLWYGQCKRILFLCWLFTFLIVYKLNRITKPSTYTYTCSIIRTVLTHSYNFGFFDDKFSLPFSYRIFIKALLKNFLLCISRKYNTK